MIIPTVLLLHMLIAQPQLAETDLCCTSSNAIKIVQSVPEDK